MQQIKFPPVSIQYFNILVKAYQDLSDLVIKNQDKDHAEAALIYLYSKATKNVKIFCKNMGKKPDNEVSTLLKEKWRSIILNEKITVEVIAEEPDFNSYRLNFLKKHLGDSLNLNNHLFHLNRENYDILRETMDEKKHFHFTTIDNQSYRLEHDVENHVAFLNFNDPKTASTLNGNFEKIKGEEIKEEEVVIA